ncbi:hypothetical protein HanIR_Chr13g0618371 [Helianthus annuus]|nr:hypothetical protein HanIR_Chr13g0618371 [Helianthus annuus]
MCSHKALLWALCDTCRVTSHKSFMSLEPVVIKPLPHHNQSVKCKDQSVKCRDQSVLMQGPKCKMQGPKWKMETRKRREKSSALPPFSSHKAPRNGVQGLYGAL